MHEYSMAQSVFESALAQVEQHKALRVIKLKLEVGELSFVTNEPLRHSFAMIAPGTPLEGCELEIVHIPAAVGCSACGYEGPVVLPSESEDESASSTGSHSHTHNEDHDHDAHDHHKLPPLQCPKCGEMPEIISGSGVVVRDMELELED